MQIHYDFVEFYVTTFNTLIDFWVTSNTNTIIEFADILVMYYPKK